MKMFSKILVASAAAAVAVVALTATSISGQAPPDLPCVTWEKSSSYVNTPPVSTLFIAAIGWVIQDADDPTQCISQGDLIPCWSASQEAGITNTWGHHDYLQFQIPSDYCRIWTSGGGSGSGGSSSGGGGGGGQVYMANNFYLPKKGPKWETWKWVLTQQGAEVPANAIRFGDKVMAQSVQAPPGNCAGVGFTGWARGEKGGTFGRVHFAIANEAVDDVTDFKVAVCKAMITTTVAPTPAPTAAPTGAPTASPTMPPNNQPYIRFGHAVPTKNMVTATITQGAISKTWSCYPFGKFSGWEEQFAVGNGQISITECGSSTVIFNQTLYLTPGPLVVVIKGYWPLNMFSLEGIAASYVPKPPGISGARLFNLMPDVASAGMTANGQPLVDKVRFTLGSYWANIDAQQTQTYQAFDDSDNTVLASDTFDAPPSPFVFSNFLIGLKNATAGSSLAARFVPLIDAPESI